MHLLENTLLDLGLGVKVIRNMTQYPLNHVTYAPVKIEDAKSNCFRRRCIYKKNTLFDIWP